MNERNGSGIGIILPIVQLTPRKPISQSIQTMERLPNELIDRILGYSVDHFSEMIYQGAVCRLWKKIADESLLWFSLKLKY
jgi:hypothetical protein